MPLTATFSVDMQAEPFGTALEQNVFNLRRQQTCKLHPTRRPLVKRRSDVINTAFIQYKILKRNHARMQQCLYNWLNNHTPPDCSGAPKHTPGDLHRATAAASAANPTEHELKLSQHPRQMNPLNMTDFFWNTGRHLYCKLSQPHPPHLPKSSVGFHPLFSGTDDRQWRRQTNAAETPSWIWIIRVDRQGTDLHT